MEMILISDTKDIKNKYELNLKRLDLHSALRIATHNIKVSKKCYGALFNNDHDIKAQVHRLITTGESLIELIKAELSNDNIRYGKASIGYLLLRQANDLCHTPLDDDVGLGDLLGTLIFYCREDISKCNASSYPFKYALSDILNYAMCTYRNNWFMLFEYVSLIEEFIDKNPHNIMNRNVEEPYIIFEFGGVYLIRKMNTIGLTGGTDVYFPYKPYECPDDYPINSMDYTNVRGIKVSEYEIEHHYEKLNQKSFMERNHFKKDLQ